jgi:hypothetical protein
MASTPRRVALVRLRAGAWNGYRREGSALPSPRAAYRDHTRYFAPWTPIPVSPIGLRFISPYGMFVALVEIVMFSPLFWFGFRTRVRDGGLRPD